MNKIFLFLGIATLVLSNQYVPIPNKPLGVSKGDSKKLIIEAFFDLQCPDSRNSFRILDQVLQQGYGTQFKYTIHMFPLPYHRAAFPEAQGFAFLSEINTEAAYLFAKTIFDNQETLAEAATLEWTWQEILNKVAQFAKENVYPKYQYDEVKFAKSLLPGTDWNLKARYWWKYGTYRTVSGAPIFIVNGVILNGAEEYDVQEWIDFINQKNPKSAQEL
ncbi:unnamed protein product [Paramecium pentaurelia]|uniref:Thioredoxin-like fold domain-containing protein n=1 Tax=Paramecium pentaurelia TaxID=43138 RepID=A0A8S1SDR3_9CILI|nr:unnamed protein product [Paramecium pentaurelia]